MGIISTYSDSITKASRNTFLPSFYWPVWLWLNPKPPLTLMPQLMPGMATTAEDTTVDTEDMEATDTMAARSVRLTLQSSQPPTLHPQLPPLFTRMVMPSVMVMVFTTHPLSVIPLNIKQLNIFLVPSLLWPVNLQQSMLPLPTDTDMATGMDSTTPSLL